MLISMLWIQCGASSDNGQDDDGLELKDENNQDDNMNNPDSLFTFLALGDSYTIGESVEVSERWPVQLVDRINAQHDVMDSAVIVARTGWTTDELNTGIDNASLDGPYNFVSLLIGVNNQFRGYPIEDYGPEFEALLDRAIAFSNNQPGRVFVVSIPDYGFTRFGQTRNPEQIAEEIDAYNAINKAIADDKGIAYFDITPISRRGLEDPTLVATDNLHPSGKMYEQWVDLIYPWMIAKIQDQ